MGVYLNSKKSGAVYKNMVQSSYFVDKTAILGELIPIVEQDFADPRGAGGKDIRYICVTRPRRFGKTVMASMIASFFGKGEDSRRIFQRLFISGHEGFERHLNKHNVIHITFNEMPDECADYSQYIARIKRRLKGDLKKAFPNIEIEDDAPVWDILNDIYEYEDEAKFIFVLDEWDFIYHQAFVTEEEKGAFTRFLSILLKDQPYVEMAYMTGILPISKYSSGSELNMFFEFSMAIKEKFSEYFGFTDKEVDALYQKYLETEIEPKVTRSGLEIWYDGYYTVSRKRLYNPRSVIGALTLNQLGSYWTSSGPYDEIYTLWHEVPPAPEEHELRYALGYTYVKNDIGSIKEDIGLMMAGIPVPANVQEYSSTSTKLTTKDEIYSAMVVYGFLSYKEGYVSIPNKELMDKFADMVRQKPAFGYIYQLAAESQRMLDATKAGDTETMAEILEIAHNTESPLIRYSNEAELSKVITFVYLQAREYYDIRQEDRSGTGYVDYIFYPYQKNDDGIIIELKVDDTADQAIRQIKERQYSLNFDGRLGEESKCTGRILAVGIAYNRKDGSKRHECKVEVLRERLENSQ